MKVYITWPVGLGVMQKALNMTTSEVLGPTDINYVLRESHKGIYNSHIGAST